jgi:hypothetical protein
MSKYKHIVIDEKGMLDPSQCPEMELEYLFLRRKAEEQKKEDE